MLQTSSSYSAILEKNSKKDVSLERMKTWLKSSSSRHHMSISDKEDSSFSTPNTTTRGKQVLHSMVIYNGLSRNKCSVILDNGRGTSYISILLIEKMNKRPQIMEVGNTDITLHTTTENYYVYVSNIGDYHSFQLKVRHTEKRILLLYQTETTKQFAKRKSILRRCNTLQFGKDFTNNLHSARNFRVQGNTPKTLPRLVRLCKYIASRSCFEKAMVFNSFFA